MSYNTVHNLNVDEWNTNFLSTEKVIFEKYMPGLQDKLSSTPFSELEAMGTSALTWFKEHGGPSLLIPKIFNGKEVMPLDMVRIQRALGYYSPSLAIATNMHTCTVAAIPPCDATAKLLTMIANNNLYVASGFAEGRTSVSVQAPCIKVKVVENGLVLSGSKKPCSLAKSMDLFTASILVPQGDGDARFALVTMPADSAGIGIKPFTNSDFLAGAENMEVTLDEVFVPNEFVSYFGEEKTLTKELSYAFLWFEMFVSASYLGVVSRLVEKLYLLERGSPEKRTDLVVNLESSMLSLEAVAHYIMAGQVDDVSVSKSLFARYHVQKNLTNIANDAAEQLGGILYLTNFEIPYLLTVSRALAFHPPSKFIMSGYLDNYMKGEELMIP